MNEQLRHDLRQLDALLELTTRRGLEFLKHIDQRPTSGRWLAESPSHLPAAGLGADAAIRRFATRFDSALVASTGPRYWGFVTGGATPAAIAGDWLTSIYDQNTQTTSGHGDISAVIEQETIALLLDLFGLPGAFLGGFVTGATISNFTCLAVARQWLGKASGRDIAREGVCGDLPILSATPHSSAIKSLAMLGIGSSNLTVVGTTGGDREAIDIEDLERILIQLQGRPCIVIASGGTVNTVDFDDFQALARLKEKYRFWLHTDAAFGGFAACSPAHAHLLQGWEVSDSITIDGHKWLNVPYESAIFLVREEHKQLQVETFQNANAPYLGDPLENFSYLNFLPENSRRLRALPSWFTLMAYGKDGYRDIVENSVAMAALFGDFIFGHDAFELLAPVRLNTVCFTLAGNPDRSAPFLDRLNDSGKVFMTPTLYRGVRGIRAAFVNWRTTPADIEIATAEMARIVREDIPGQR